MPPYPPKKIVTEKRCATCGETKPIDDFPLTYSVTHNSDGHHSWCKRCQTQYRVARRRQARHDKAVNTPYRERTTYWKRRLRREKKAAEETARAQKEAKASGV